MKKPLKEIINQKMTRHSLSEEQLQQLTKKISSQTTSHKPADSSRFKLAGIASSIFVLALTIGLLLPIGKHQVTESMPQRIANEVVKNHLNLKPLEVHTNTLDGLIHYFRQLDFLLRPSQEIGQLTESLLGGRYCSLQGITAAQLRLKSQKNKQTDTLYQTEYRKQIFGELPDIDKKQQPLIAWAKGIKVRIWVEKGILFAVTDVSASRQ